MSIVAGVDIGNSTTEVVFADLGSTPPCPIAWDRVPTRGVKGSPEAAQRAARLVKRITRRTGVSPHMLALTPQAPVRTEVTTVPLDEPSLGRLCLLDQRPTSPAGTGVALGRPCDAELTPPLGVPTIMVARDPLGFRSTAATIEAWRARGVDVRGALLAGDEARLVHARIAPGLVIVDRIDPDSALACDLVLLEVGTTTVRELADPLYLTAALELGADERNHAVTASALVRDAPCAVLGRLRHQDQAPVTAQLPASTGSRTPASQDTWSVDLAEVATPAALRRASSSRQRATSTLAHLGEATVDLDTFRSILDHDLRVVGDEASAAAAGARTTPGSTSDTLVLDLGGGTIDVIGRWATTGAGSGELLTACIAALAGISRGTAEWVKRGPAVRMETPFIVTTETGGRAFLEQPVNGALVGWLAAIGPAGYLPFSRDLALGDWRDLRRSVKGLVLEENVRRLTQGYFGDITSAVAVGGPVGDDEILECLSAALPQVAVGRGNVAGRLGHRYGVAYGLALLAAEGDLT